jgi:hypothetical protein
MDEFDPVPERASRARWQEGVDTFGRVYDVVLGTTALTPYAEIADLADCSPNAAKKHLDRLAGMGVVRADRDAEPARYARDDGYLEWQEARRIADECSTEEIIERVAELEAECERHEQEFDAPDPAAVSAFDASDHGSVHERMVAVSDWHAAVRDIRLYELARQLAQNDGHLVPHES